MHSLYHLKFKFKLLLELEFLLESKLELEFKLFSRVANAELLAGEVEEDNACYMR